MKRSALSERAALRRSAFALTAGCAVLLTACESSHRELDNVTAVHLNNPELRHPIRFDTRVETLDVEVPVGAEGLSPNQVVDVYRFLKRYKREANSRLIISVPGGPRDPASIAQSLQGIQRYLVEAGIDYRLTRGKRPPANEVPAIRIAYQRPVAVPPVCDKWGENVGRNEARIPYPNFGCATQHNKAVMVDTARDLQGPQGEDPRSGERRSVTWSGYVAAPAGGGDSGGGDIKKAPAIKK